MRTFFQVFRYIGFEMLLGSNVPSLRRSASRQSAMYNIYCTSIPAQVL